MHNCTLPSLTIICLDCITMDTLMLVLSTTGINLYFVQNSKLLNILNRINCKYIQFIFLLEVNLDSTFALRVKRENFMSCFFSMCCTCFSCSKIITFRFL